MSFGIVTIGWPGVGKTPFLIVLSLATGRYHISRQGLHGLHPSWRRAKALENFRHRAGEVHEGLILEDPTMDKLDATDMKSWLTSEEDQNCSARYNDVKLVRNGLRARATNEFKQEDEPDFDMRRQSITPDGFSKICSVPCRTRAPWPADPQVLRRHRQAKSKLATRWTSGAASPERLRCRCKLVHKFFQNYKETDVLAILKRSVVLVFGKKALYLRLPSQEKDAVIHQIHVDDCHNDLFSDREKSWYAKYKIGINEVPPTLKGAVQHEMLMRGMERMLDAGRPETYVQMLNPETLRALSLPRTVRRLPSSPSTDPENRVPVPHPEALPINPVAAPKRLGTFVYPECRVIGKKSTADISARSTASGSTSERAAECHTPATTPHNNPKNNLDGEVAINPDEGDTLVDYEQMDRDLETLPEAGKVLHMCALCSCASSDSEMVYSALHVRTNGLCKHVILSGPQPSRSI